MLLFWPLVIPFFTAVLCILAWRSLPLQRAISLAGALALLAVAAPHPRPTSSATGPFAEQAGGWPAPFGITMVADRLSALMVVLVGLVAVTVLAFGLADASREEETKRPPPPHPRAARRHLRRLPDRRHLQHVRLVRGDADRLLRPPRHRRRQGRARRRDEVRRPQPHRHRRLHLRRRPPLRRHRRAQHGRPAYPPRRPHGRDPDPRRRGVPHLRLRLQGRALPALLLAPRLLPHPLLRHLRPLLGAPHQGRGLRAHPRLHPRLPRRRHPDPDPPPLGRRRHHGRRRPRVAGDDRGPPRARLLDHLVDRLHDPRPRRGDAARHRRRASSTSPRTSS